MGERRGEEQNVPLYWQEVCSRAGHAVQLKTCNCSKEHGIVWFKCER